MKHLLRSTLWSILIPGLVLCLQNCKKTEPDPVKPGTTTNPGSGTTTNPGATATVPTFNSATAPITSGIASTSATVSAVVEGSGGAAISQHGFVYSKTAQTPTLADSKVELGATTGPFPLTITSKLTGLEANTTYNVRAYATNSTGTSYGGVGQVKTSAIETPTSNLADWKTARSLGEGFDYTRANSLIADASGNYYLTGTYSRAGKIGKFSVTPAGGTNGQDGFVVKLDPTGEPLWILELKTTSSDEVYSLDQDADGNIYAALDAGTQAGTFGSVTLPAGYGRLAKITPQGTVEWVRSTSTSIDGGITLTKVDDQGNYYVTGRMLGNKQVKVGNTTLTGTDPAWTLNNGTEGIDTFIARFDRNGTLQWTRQISGPGQQVIMFDVDPNGAVYMDVKSDKGPASVGGTAFQSAGEHLLKLSATGAIEWSKVIHTNGGTSFINELYCRSTGEFLIGSVNGPGLSIDGGPITSAANPILVALYKGDGTLKWSTTTPAGYIGGRVLDNTGNLYITTYGNKNNPFTVGSITLPAQTGENDSYLVVAKYSPAQNKWLWAIRSRNLSNTYASSAMMAIAPSGILMLDLSYPTGDIQFGSVKATMPLRFGDVLVTIEQK